LNKRAADDRIDDVKRKQQTFFNARIKLPEIKHPSYKTARDISSPTTKRPKYTSSQATCAPNYITFQLQKVPKQNIPTKQYPKLRCTAMQT
jgi:hypothetical protein